MDEWLAELSATTDTDDAPDITLVREQAIALRTTRSERNETSPPKATGPVAHSGLAGLLGAEDANLVYEQLRDKPVRQRR